MIEFIYVNQPLEMGLITKPLNIKERIVSEEEQDFILKHSTRIEDFHFLSFGSGCLMINETNGGQFRISPSSGIIDIYYLLNFYCEPELQFNYCVEEFYTVNENDDEYCVSIKSEFLAERELIILKNNNQKETCVYDYYLFKEELLKFSNQLLAFFQLKYPIFIESPMMKIFKEKIEDIS